MKLLLVATWRSPYQTAWETSKNTPIGAHHPSSLAKCEGPAPSKNSASVTSQTNGSTANSKSTPLATSASSGSSPSVDGSVSSANSVDLTACSNVHFESRDGLPGVCYKDTENTASWTPVIGRRKKRPRLPAYVLRKFPPDHPLRQDQSNLSSESGSEEDEELCIPQNANVCFNIMKGKPGLQIRTKNTYKWTPIASRTRLALSRSNL